MYLHIIFLKNESKSFIVTSNVPGKKLSGSVPAVDGATAMK